MALLVMILRKMIKNKWLELSLLLGLILSVALVSSMPIYTNAILQRMLIKDLENRQLETNQYPGVFRASAYFGDAPADKTTGIMSNFEQFMDNEIKPIFNVPIKYAVKEKVTELMSFDPVDPQKVDAKVNRYGQMRAIQGMENQIHLTDGRMPAKEPINGVYEVLVVEEALNKQKMVLGNEFVTKADDKHKSFKVKPVGVFDKKSVSSLFWSTKNFRSYDTSFFIPYALYEKDFTSAKVAKTSNMFSYFVLDYTKFDLNNIENYMGAKEQTETYLVNHFVSNSLTAESASTIEKYFDREQRLRTMLWSMNVPVMIMLAFYLYMVANLITDRQKTEIAVLRSRGASRLQIMTSFLIEGLMLGAVAFLLGPPVGVLLTKVLGASNGFLEFVQRSAIHAEVDATSYKYAVYAVLSSLVMTLIPAMIATRTTIVGHKQQMARKHAKSFWHKFFLDVVLIGVSIYGLTTFRRRMDDLLSLGLDSSQLKIDPLLFLVPALFILGSGLLILRIYPWFIRLIYFIGKRWWPPSLYSTLIQVGRSATQYQFLMIFLIMTIATGLFSASAARTMNQNVEDRIRYGNGADIVLTTRWESDAKPVGMGSPQASAEPEKKEEFTPNRVQYSEPSFLPFTQLPGIEASAKVFIKEDANFSAGSKNGNAEMVGIDTDDFGRTSWIRDGLLDHHFYNYLNLIAEDPSAVLISKSLADETGLRPGDYIYAGWSSVDPAAFIVYGIIDYFPTFNPNVQKDPNSDGNKLAPKLIVGHLSYIQQNLALEPYQVWLKLKNESSARDQLYKAIADRHIEVESFKDTQNDLLNAKNDPFQLAMNGVLTLGFLISIIISFFGFLLYWILSLQSRILQLGIFRAMGISFAQLIAMLVAEQLLTSGAAIIIGMLTGNVTGNMYVPMFQLAFDPTVQVPPFKVIFDRADSVHMYTIVSVMMIIGLGLLGYMLSKIKIHQAVKLGED